MSKGQYQIPFDEEGNQLHYPEIYRWLAGRRQEVQWKDNLTFQDRLRYAGYERGRSAAYFTFERESGGMVTVFLKDFEAIIPVMCEGIVEGTFTFTKRGQNYGCQMVPA